MNKRYQVFVGSAFDLMNERSLIIQTLIYMDCIPEGMQMFPVTQEKEFEHIKLIIDSSDCYLLVLGGASESNIESKMIYLKKEYEYALDKGLELIVLMHHNFETIFRPEQFQILPDFYSSIKSNSIVSYWNNASDLQKKLLSSFSKTIDLSTISASHTIPKTDQFRSYGYIEDAENTSEMSAIRTHTSLVNRIIDLLGKNVLLNKLTTIRKIIEMPRSLHWVGNKEKEFNRLKDGNSIFSDPDKLIKLAQHSFANAAKKAIKENDEYEIPTHGADKGQLIICQPAKAYSCDLS